MGIIARKYSNPNQNFRLLFIETRTSETVLCTKYVNNKEVTVRCHLFGILRQRAAIDSVKESTQSRVDFLSLIAWEKL